LLIQLNIIIMQ